ncbi:hypothetical protein CHELA20_53995 [Hyphomicrobiales bacterium]|nr:hypothetical protein CHELA20_53995 [Hyphomicrobiales bacterium]
MAKLGRRLTEPLVASLLIAAAISGATGTSGFYQSFLRYREGGILVG